MKLAAGTSPHESSPRLNFKGGKWTGAYGTLAFLMPRGQGIQGRELRNKLPPPFAVRSLKRKCLAAAARTFVEESRREGTLFFLPARSFRENFR